MKTIVLPILALATLALSACSTQYAKGNKNTGDFVVVNNNFLNKKKNERFAFKIDPKTGEVKMNVSSQGMNNASVAEGAVAAYSLGVAAGETTQQIFAKEKTAQKGAEQAAVINGQNTAPTVYNAAEGFKVDRAIRSQ